MQRAQKFADYLNKSHSQFHAIAEAEKELQEAGYIKLKENTTWKLENNRYYYVVRDMSSLIAFKIPEMVNVKSLNIVASHSDSPSLKVKQIEQLNNPNYTRLSVEIYGGPIMSTWLDRPLSIAGRVTYKENGSLVTKLVDFDDEPVLMVPNVAIHQNRNCNEGMKWNGAVDMVPLLATGEDKDYFRRLLADKLGISTNDIYGHDLVVYNADKSICWGKDKEFISGQRIDNLMSAYTSLEAFKLGFSAKSIDILGIFDHEESGAVSKKGMGGRFLRDTIERIFESFFYSSADIKAILANSFLISCDGAHAIHPNHPEMFDSTNNCYLNKGPVIKTSAGLSYVSDGLTIAVLKQLAEKADTPCQIFANRSDVRGGGTQAGISSMNVGLHAVDIGCPQFAMHSCYETAGSKDVDYMIDLLTEFYNSTITFEDNKTIIEK